MYSGFDSLGEWFQLFQIGFGGIPGRPFGDGADGHSLWPGFTNVPNEFLERYFPLRIERYETIADSGGAGKNRGGNGILMAYRFLETGTISIHDDRWFIHPWGVNGGLPGKRSAKVLHRADGTTEVLGAKIDNIQVKKGDLLDYITWGGGGWGNPLERDAELVALEVKRGLVSFEGARSYGVVVTADYKVDAAATARLRADMAGQIRVNEIFNFGPEISELRKACQRETGLPAPIQPSWSNARGAA
jgi:N-methylhydantoinase B